MQDSELPPTTRLSGGGHGRWQAPSVAELQAMLPQYEILHLLGQGGMGAVYQGRQKSLRRTVAIKVLPPVLAEEDLRGAERFRHEAYALAQMSHPRIVTVYDFGETPEGQLYFVMEFVDGTDVGQILQSSGRLTADHALKIAAQVCEALAYAHARGVIHRDIKPANVLLDRQGQVKVADFGLAKLDDPALTHALTRSNTAMGTPDYVAPEALIPGRVPDHRADLYAVGVMLYQMLTGEVPRGMFKLPSQKVPEADIRIDAIICKAMEQDREDRYQTAEVLQKDLDEVLTKPLLKQEPAVPAVSQTPARSNKKLVLGAVGVAIAAAAVWAWVGFHDVPSRTGSPSAGVPPEAPRGRVIDLLALVDVQRDAVAGEWSREGHELMVKNEGLAAAGGAPRLQLPYKPHREYDFEIEFTSAPGNSRLGQMLSVNSRAFGWLLSEDPNKRRIAGFGFLDQQPTTRLTETAAMTDIDFNDGRRHRSRVEVRTGSLRGYVDDKLIVDWSGDFRRLGTDAISKLRDNEHLGLRVDGGYVFHAIQVREVTGVGILDEDAKEVDLLALVDVKRDVIAGEWSREGSDLLLKYGRSSKGSGNPRLQLPYQPPEEYDFEMEFTPIDGQENVYQLLSAYGKSFSWVMDARVNAGMKCGFESIDRTLVTNRAEGSVMREFFLVNGQRHRSKIEVRKTGLRAFLDEKLLVVWGSQPASFQSLDMLENVALRDSLHLGIAAQARSLRIHRVAVREVTGTGTTDTATGTQPDANPPPISNWQDVTETMRTKALKSPELMVEPGAVRHRGSGKPISMKLTGDGAPDYAVRVRYNGEVQVGLRWNPGGSYYVLSQRRQMFFHRHKEGVVNPAELIPGRPHPSGHDPNQPHELLVIMQGPNLRAWLDGRFVATMQDGTFPEGTAGLTFTQGSAVQKVEVAELPPDDTKKNEKPEASVAVRTVDLLALVDVKRDSIRGDWSRGAEGLRLKAGPDSNVDRLQLPYQPPAEYDLEMEFTPESGTREIYQVLSAFGRQFSWVMDVGNDAGMKAGFENLDGKSVQGNRDGTVLRDHFLTNGRRHSTRMEVRKEGVSAYLDGQLLLRWGASADVSSRLALPPSQALREATHLGVGARKRALILHKIQVREITGTGAVDTGQAFADTANPGAERAGRTVDLLALVDVARDPLRGIWTRSSRGVSVAPQSGVTILELPYQPPEEYDYEIEFTPDNDGLNVNQFLSAGGQPFIWKLNSHNITPPLYGFELLDGRFAKDLREAATQLDFAIEKGKRYHSKVEVRRGSLRALVNGEEVVRWSGDFKRFSTEDHSRMRNELHLGVGSWKRAVTFHKIQVTEISGTGRVDAGATHAAKWSDWLGPWLAKWQFNGKGWIKEGEGVTTDQQFRGEIVLPATTRDAAVRLGYTMRDSEGASVTFRHDGEGEGRKFYVAYDAHRTLYISRAIGAEQVRLASESIPADIAANPERTLEVRFVGNRLTATLNGSFTVTATDNMLTQGECAMVLHKGALLKKVETLALDASKVSPVNDSFMQMIARVNGPRQVEIVSEKIEQLNGVKPLLVPAIVSGKVTGLAVRTSEPTITDISPVAALRHLTVLSTDNNKISDISCLAGLPLEELSLFGESVTDISVLKSLPLKNLSFRGSRVVDFSVLAGKPLERLQLNLCRELKDISFVKGMPLTYLKIDYTAVRDLSSLAGLPLTEIECNPDIKLDAALLRSIPTLKIFNKKPVAELLAPDSSSPPVQVPGDWQPLITKPEDFGKNLKGVDPKCVEFRDGVLFLKDNTIVTKQDSTQGAVRTTVRYVEGRTGSVTIRASEDVKWGQESFATGAYISSAGKTVVLYVRHPKQKGTDPDKHTFNLPVPVKEGDLFSIELRIANQQISVSVNGRQAGAVADPTPATKRQFGVMPPLKEFGEYREIAWQPLPAAL